MKWHRVGGARGAACFSSGGIARSICGAPSPSPPRVLLLLRDPRPPAAAGPAAVRRAASASRPRVRRRRPAAPAAAAAAPASPRFPDAHRATRLPLPRRRAPSVPRSPGPPGAGAPAPARTASAGRGRSRRALDSPRLQRARAYQVRQGLHPAQAQLLLQGLLKLDNPIAPGIPGAHPSARRRGRGTARLRGGAAKRPAALPDAVDHRNDGTEGPVKDQGQVGACTAFSLSTAMDNAIRRQNGSDTTSTLHIWSHYG